MHIEVTQIIMLENRCTRTVQPLHVGCRRRVHRIVYIAVKKGKYFGQYFTSENIMNKTENATPNCLLFIYKMMQASKANESVSKYSKIVV